MANQENPKPKLAHGKKSGGQAAGKKAQNKKAAGSGSSSGGGGNTQTQALRVIDANAASHEANRPRTPIDDLYNKESDKASDVGLTENTSPRRKGSVKLKTATPDTATRMAPAAEPSTPSKIARPKAGSISRDPPPPVEDHDVDADVEKDTEKTEVDSMGDVGDERMSGLMDGPRDTQEDLCGFPVTKCNGSAQDPVPESKIVEADADGKFPGWDDYPTLSIDENDRESRARERRYYRAYGVRFAPWNIPFKRRLQTLAVLIHSLSIASTVSFFFFLCAIPLTWPLLIPYLLHMLLSKAATDGRLRFRSERFRRAPIWKFFADYYPARLHKTHDLPATRKYIFGYHPHGIISHGAFAAFATEALGFDEKFPGITNSLLTLESNFRIPLYREYILSLGIQSVSKESITNILTRGGRNGEGMGRAVTIVIGGARESLEAQPGTMHLVLGERKGFIKLAIRTGADLVPVLAFGENDLYDQVSPKTYPGLRRLQMWVLRTLKFTLPFLHGRGIFNYDVGLMPYRRPLNIVVGKPIKVAQARGGDVDMAEVERLHKVYIQELRKMWDRYKDEFAAEREEEMVILK